MSTGKLQMTFRKLKELPVPYLWKSRQCITRNYVSLEAHRKKNIPVSNALRLLQRTVYLHIVHLSKHFCIILKDYYNITNHQNIFNLRSHGWFLQNRIQNSQLNNLDILFQFSSGPFSSSSCIVCSCTKLFLRCTQHLADVSQSKSSRSGLFMNLLRILVQEILKIGEK